MGKINELIDEFGSKFKLSNLGLGSLNLDKLDGIPFVSQKKWSLMKVIINTPDSDLPSTEDWTVFFSKVMNTKWRITCEAVRGVCKEILDDLKDPFFANEGDKALSAEEYDAMMALLYPSWTEIRKLLKDYPDVLAVYESEYNVIVDRLEGQNFARFSFHHSVCRLIGKLKERTKVRKVPL
jgi:hypothetical protein